jgi:hypothetical protein
MMLHMEALISLAPLVLVLRGTIMGAVASASAPGSFPHHPTPAQSKTERADATVEIVRPIVLRPETLVPDRNGDVSINGYRLNVQRRLNAEHHIPEQPAKWLLVIDLP